jgi:hypothetical protein
VRHQSKWRVKFAGSSTTDPWISSSDPTIEEDVTHPMSRNRAKAVTQKGKKKGKGKEKRKEDLSNQSESFSALGDMMSTLKKLSISFAKAQL